jgi:hypothetical protein
MSISARSKSPGDATVDQSIEQAFGTLYIASVGPVTSFTNASTSRV